MDYERHPYIEDSAPPYGWREALADAWIAVLFVAFIATLVIIFSGAA